MSTAEKDTIYIDIDDEITGIIDKLKSSDSKLVALVLPKRATVFQSIVNMKLIKRAADASGKNLVLITSEAGLMPLAGAAGVFVAKTLNSKPEIPVGPDQVDDSEETIDETGNVAEDVTAATAGGVAVGALAGAAVASNKDDGLETLELDNESPLAEASKATSAAKPKDFTPPKPKKDKKLKVPDFDRFRLLLIAGGIALVALIVFGYFAIRVLPKATIVIDTDATTVETELDFTLSTTATELDPEQNIVPAKQVQQQKSYTQQVATTGQKNNGNKASGTVTLTNCSQSDDITLPAGSGLSSNGNTYITQSSVTVPASSFKKSVCQNDGKANVNVIAQSPGTSFNGATSFSVPSNSSLSGSASGSISGGTDNIVRTVNQNDINNAKSKINLEDPSMKSDLEGQLRKAGYFPVKATFNSGTPAVTTSNSVGQVADNVTVTQNVTYSMLGAQRDDLATLVTDSIKEQIDTQKQSILDDGIDSATYTVSNLTATGAQISIKATATAGPDLDVDQIKQEALGQKPAAIRDSLKNNPDVKNVDVKLSPFWVSSVPKKESKVIVKIEKPATTKASSANGDNP